MNKYHYMTLASGIALAGSLHAIEETTIEVSSGNKKVGFGYRGTSGIRTDKALWNPTDRRWGVVWEETNGVRTTVDRTEAPPAGCFGTDELSAPSYYSASGSLINPATWPKIKGYAYGLAELVPNAGANVNRQAWIWTGNGSSYLNWPAYYRAESYVIKGFRPPVAMTLSYPGGISELKISAQFETSWASINTTRFNHADNSSFYWAGMHVYSPDPSGIGYNYGSSLTSRCDGGIGTPVVILSAKNGSWSIIAPVNPDPVTSVAYTKTLYTVSPPAWSGAPANLPATIAIPEEMRKYSINTTVNIPKVAGADYKGDIDVTVVGFRGEMFFAWPQGIYWGPTVTYPGLAANYGLTYSGFHVPTSGSVSISDPSSLTGTITAPPGLMEGYKGNIPIQFSVAKE